MPGTSQALGTAAAIDAGRRLVCAVRCALSSAPNTINQIYVCGNYSIQSADEFATDVAAFRKIGQGQFLRVSGLLCNNAGGAIISAAAAADPGFRFFFVENGGELELENLTLRDGRADRVTNASGGAVFVESTAAGNGTASRFAATDCAFINNRALADGGAIRFEDGNRPPAVPNPPVRGNALFQLTRCTFTQNQAQQLGGAVATGDITWVRGCTFTGNRAGRNLPSTADGLGGGLWAGPRAGAGGGASAPVFVEDSTGIVLPTQFVANLAGEGGGMFVRGPGERELIGVQFRSNQAQAPISGSGETGGGGLHAESSDEVRITMCTFGGAGAGNSATVADAGGVLSELTNMIIVNSVFLNNTAPGAGGASGQGGAGRMSGSQRSLYRQCIIEGNSSVTGGGVAVDNNADVAFDDCIFRSNTATGNGGSLFLGGGRPFVYNCTMTSGQAVRGAGIFNNGAGAAILHTTIADIRGPAGVRAIEFGPKPSDPIIIQNSIIGDEWSLPLTDRAFEPAALPSFVRVRFCDVEIVDINAFNLRVGSAGPYGGNINCDPLFANLAGGDVHLTECSPAIDRASELESNILFAGVTVPTQWQSLLSTFFVQCIGDAGGHCNGDYDDNPTIDDVMAPFGQSDRDLNLNILDLPIFPAIASPGQTLRKTACESDMGADEFERDLRDVLTVYCDPAVDGKPPFEIASADACEPLATGPACGPLCEGEGLCLTGTFDGRCETGVIYQWYFRDDPANNPALCGPLNLAYVPVQNNGRITGANTPNLCFSAVERCDTGCYRLTISRPTCGAPSRFYCPEDLRGVVTPFCSDTLEVEVCISVYQAPEIQVQPLPATVCLGGTQQLCSTILVPPGCEPQCTWYRVVGARDPVNGPMFPVDDIAVCPVGAPPAGITCGDSSLGGGVYSCCLNFSPGTINHQGEYYVVVTCGSLQCSAQSDPAELRVIDPQPVVNSAAVCLGGRQCLEQLAVLPTLTPGSSYTYQWYRRPESDCLATPCPAGDCSSGTPLTNSPPFSGVDTPTLCIDPASASLRGCYYVVVGIDGTDPGSLPDEGKCFSASNCACLTVVNPLPVVANAAVCLGGTQTLEQTATLPTLPAGYVYTYQWFFRGTSNCLATPCDAGDCTGGTPVSNGGRFGGATTPNLTVTGAIAADAGCYYVRVGIDGPEGPAIDAGKCLKNSNCACLSVVNPQPTVANAAVCFGGTQTLEQTATLPTLPAGYVYTYQWFFRGTSNCLATPCDIGDCTGGTPVSDNGRITGSMTPNLSIANANAADAGCYYVRVGIDGPEGPAIDAGKCLKNSNCACLTVVNPQPMIANAAVCIGGTQTLEQTATLPALPSGYVYTYQWFFRGTSNCLTTPCDAGDCTGGTAVVDSGRITGALTPNLTITNAMAGDAGCYYVRVGIDGPEGAGIDAAKCLKNSNCACLSVVNPQPVVANAAVCVGGTQTLEQTITLPALPAGYVYTYQWFFRGTSNCLTTPCDAGECGGGAPVVNGGHFSGATTPNLTISNAGAADAGCYYVRVGIDGPEGAAIDAAKCLKNSNCACVTVVDPLPVVANAAVCVGGTQTLEQTAVLPTLPAGYIYTYQWFFRGTSNCITTPCDAGPCTGGAVIGDGGRFSGATTPNLTISGATAADAGCYYVRVGIDGPEGPAIDAGKCLKNSNCACLVVVNPQPMVNNAAVCLGGTQTLEQTATLPALPAGYVYTYRWFFRGTSNCIATPCGAGDCTGGTPISDGGRFSGATTPNLTITGAQAADAGCYYVVVTLDGPEGPAQDGPKCNKASNCACLSVVNPQPMIANAAVCIGGRQCLEVSALPGLPPNYTYTYQWFRLPTSNCLTTPCQGGTCGGGTELTNSGGFSGVTTPVLCIDPATAGHQGCYYVRVGIDGPEGPAQDGPKCSAFSNCACLTVVNPTPVVLGRTVCVGGDQCLSVNAGSFPALPANYSYTFQWYFVGNADCAAAPCPGGSCSGGTPLGNNSVYSGVDTPTLCINDALLVHQGCYYVQVGVNGPEDGAIDAAKCLVFSNCACLRVVAQPTFSAQPQNAAVCVGGRQTLMATVSNPAGLTLCLQWYRKDRCDLPGEGTPVVNGSGISGATTPTLVFDPAALVHDGCYYLRVRVCNPDDLSKCPWVDSACACLDVRPPLEPCVLDCMSGESDAQGRCLYCAGVDIAICCDIAGAEGPLCFQWQYCASSGPAGCFVDIVGATGQCFVIEDFDPAVDSGCYRVRINYLDLSGPSCPETSGLCSAVYSLPLCVAETDRCCPETCDCKDNSNPDQAFYSLWKTGDWDGLNGEWSFDRSSTDGVMIKAADDMYLDPSCMHHITRFLGEMLVRQGNPLIDFTAKLYIYEDCNGAPGRQVADFDSTCPAFVSGAPDGFSRYQVKFDLTEECFWLRGGIYWLSLVAVAPSGDASFEAYWASVGLPGTPPVPIIKGRRPVFMNGAADWTEYDPCCHACTDLQFCLSGNSCPIIWDNGKPDLGGADAATPGEPPFTVFGTRSEKSTLTVRNSRAADQFVVNTCREEEVCYLEGYIFTNCTGFEVTLEIYENDCRMPQFMLPSALPVYYSAIADPANVIDLGYTGLRVGTTAVRAYKVVFCVFDQPLVLSPAKNYWVSLSVRDSFSVNERAFFAHVKQPCDPCTTPVVWRIDPGMEIAPGRQIPVWQSAGADFAFLIATHKPPESLPLDGPPTGGPCAADTNNNGQVDVPDIFTFLSAWFEGCP